MKRLISIFLLTALAISVSCARDPSPPKGKPLVVVSIPPYAYLVKEIVGETMIVNVALKANFDPHTTEATPTQMRWVQNADLFIGVGEGYERKLLGAIREGSKEVRVLEMDEKLPLLSYSQDAKFIDVCRGIDLDLTGFKDLHFWLGPKILPMQVKILIEALTALTPQNGDLYRKNGEALIQKIQALDAKLEKDLHPYQKRAIIVSHPALGYFCYDYNITQISVECEGKSPLPQNITHVLDLARNSDVICVFTGPQFHNKGAEIIAERLNLRVESFDPLAEDILTTLEKVGNAITK